MQHLYCTVPKVRLHMRSLTVPTCVCTLHTNCTGDPIKFAGYARHIDEYRLCNCKCTVPTSADTVYSSSYNVSTVSHLSGLHPAEGVESKWILWVWMDVLIYGHVVRLLQLHHECSRIANPTNIFESPSQKRYTLDLIRPCKKKSQGVRSGKRAG